MDAFKFHFGSSHFCHFQNMFKGLKGNLLCSCELPWVTKTIPEAQELSVMRVRH